MLTRTQLKEIFAEYGFTPLKRLGENYLIDGNIKDKIINEAALAKQDTVLEIGPGLGALTMDLAGSGAKTFAVEKDRKAFDILCQMADDDFPNLKIFNDDILKFNFAPIAPSKKINPVRNTNQLKDSEAISNGVKVIGNLPYYITTPIIERLIENRKRIIFILITLQREVARRLMAGPGSREYGPLSCFVQYYARPVYIHTIKRTSFYPVPDVDSSLIRLDILDRPSVNVSDEALFFRIVRGAFNQRRKSIINSLSREEVLGLSKEELSALLTGIGIDPAIRPESLSLLDFAKIADAVI